MTILVLVATEATAVKVSVSAGDTETTGLTIPIAIPRDDGESIVFDSDDPKDIVRWLHAPDDDTRHP